MSGAPSVAVVVPLRDEAESLPAALAHVEGLGADEVIWVDGGSRDATPELLARTGARLRSAPPGRAVQMNRGAAECRSDVLLFLHADTRLPEGGLAHVRRAMADPGVVGGRFDVRLSGRHPAFRVIEALMNLRSRLTRVSTGDQAIFVRRRVFESLGGYPEQPLMEDIELSARLKRAGRVACLRKRVTTSSRRWERDGILRTVLLMWRLRLLYWLGADPAALARRYRGHAP